MTDTIIYTTATRARLVRLSPSDGYSTDDFVDMGPSTTVDFYAYFGGPSGLTDTHLYIVEMDGQPFPSLDFVPVVPGATLTDIRPWVSAYVPGDPQFEWTGGSVGTLPEPTLAPWLFMDSTDSLMMQNFGTTYPPPKTVCEAADDLTVTGGNWADNLQMGGGFLTTVHIVVTGFGYQFTFTSAGGQPPLRLRQRGDSKAGGADRSRGRGRASGNRVRGCIR